MASLHGCSTPAISRCSLGWAGVGGPTQQHLVPGPSAWHAAVRCGCPRHHSVKSFHGKKQNLNTRAGRAADMAAAAAMAVKLIRSHKRCAVTTRASNGDQLPVSTVNDEAGGETKLAAGSNTSADTGRGQGTVDTTKRRAGSKANSRIRLRPGTAAALAAKWQPLLQSRGAPVAPDGSRGPLGLDTQPDSNERGIANDSDGWWLDMQPDALAPALPGNAPLLQQQHTAGSPAAFTTAGSLPGQKAQQQGQASSTATLSPADVEQLTWAYPWLLGDMSGLSRADVQTRVQYAQLLQQSLSLLVTYDISTLDGRQPPLDRNPLVIEPSLYARTQARWEASQRQESARLRVAAPANPAAAAAVAAAPHPGNVDLTNPGALMTGPVSQDAAWMKHQASQVAFLQYMKQLYSVLVPLEQQGSTAVAANAQSVGVGTPAGSHRKGAVQKRKGKPQEAAAASSMSSTAAAGQVQHLPASFPLDPQLSYQVGICEDWLQLSYLLDTFLHHIGGTTLVALYRRAVTVVTPTKMMGWGPSERQAFSIFCAQLAQRAQQLVPQLVPWHVGWVMYGIAVLEGLHDGRPYDSLSVLPPAYSFGMQLAAQPGSPASSSDNQSSSAAASGVRPAQAGMLSPATAARIQAHAALASELCKRAETLLRSQPKRKAQHSMAMSPALATAASGHSKPQPRAPASANNEEDTNSAELGSAPVLGIMDDKPSGRAGQDAPLDTSQHIWQATQYSQLIWGLGSLGYRPPPSLINLVLQSVENALERFQPPQLWGLLWGLARLSTAPGCPTPSSRWMSRYLGATERVMGEFDAQGLVHLVWSVALLNPHPPPSKQWLRAVCGAAAARLRSLTAPYLVAYVEALTVLGYAPRFEISSAIMAQLRRHLHTCTPEQLTTIMRALATLPSWAPPRQLLYDWVQAASRTMRGFTPSQAAACMCAFAQLGYLPVHDVWRNLMLRVALCGFTLASPTDLSQALWATAHLAAGSTCRGLWVDSAATYLPKGSPADTVGSSPASAAAASSAQGTSKDALDKASRAGLSTAGLSGAADQVLWLDGWMAAAARCVGKCSAPDLANMVWAAGQLGLRPPTSLVDAWLQRSLLLLPDMTTKEASQCTAGLALLQYRPPDSWLTALTQHMQPRLPECAGPDLGLLLWALASLGAPVSEEWLKVTAREASRSWSNHTGDGLGLLAWGLAQYSYSPYSDPPPDDAAVAMGRGQDPWSRQATRREAEWWSGYYASCAEQWIDMSPRALMLMLLGVAGLVHTPPPRSWQVEMLRAIRLHVPKPAASSDVIPTLLATAGLHQPKDMAFQVAPLLAATRFKRSLAAASMSTTAGPEGPAGTEAEEQDDTLDGGSGQSFGFASVSVDSESEDEEGQLEPGQGDGVSTQSPGTDTGEALSEEVVTALSAAQQAAADWRQTRTPVPTLLQAMETQGLLSEQPSLQYLLPPAALHSEWLAVLIGQLRVRWGFKRVHQTTPQQ